jgi:hypothetical protein
MFRPYVCVACEKVLFEQDDVASLVRLFSKVILKVANEAEIPPNAVAPKEWAIYSAWDADSGDEVGETLLCIEILYPDGSLFGERARIKMNVGEGRRSQVKADILGFPIGQKGAYNVRAWVEKDNQVASDVVRLKIDLEITGAQQPK